ETDPPGSPERILDGTAPSSSESAEPPNVFPPSQPLPPISIEERRRSFGFLDLEPQELIRFPDVRPLRNALSLKGLFDGFRGRLGDAENDDPEIVPAYLEKISAPLRTGNQLERLIALRENAQEPLDLAIAGDVEPGRFLVPRLLFTRYFIPDLRVFRDLLL